MENTSASLRYPQGWNGHKLYKGLPLKTTLKRQLVQKVAVYSHELAGRLHVAHFETTTLVLSLLLSSIQGTS